MLEKGPSKGACTKTFASLLRGNVYDMVGIWSRNSVCHKKRPLRQNCCNFDIPLVCIRERHKATSEECVLGLANHTLSIVSRIDCKC